MALPNEGVATATPARPSLARRIAGVLTAPRSTLAAVADSPRWLDVLVLTVLVVAGTTGAFLTTEAGRQALVERRVYTLEDFGQRVGPVEYKALQARVPELVTQQLAVLLAGVPLVTVGLALLVHVFIGRRSRAGNSGFRPVLAVVAHTHAVTMLRYVCLLPLNWWSQSLGNSLTLGVFLRAAEGSFLGNVVGTIDLFVLWWAVVLAVGISVLYDRKTGRIAAGMLAAYVVIALAVAGAKSILGTP
jgi:hypothetical protein